MPSALTTLNLAYAQFYDTRPVMTAYQTTEQTFTTSTVTMVNWQAVDVDTTSGFNLTTNTYTISVPGWYRVIAKVQWHGAANGVRFAQIRQNGVASSILIANRSPSTGVVTSSVDGLIRCVLNDTIQVWADQTSGASLNTIVTAGIYNSSWTMFWVGR